MADVGAMRETVGIRQVTHNGVKLPAAMRLDVIGGDLTTATADDGVVTYKLDLSGSEAGIVSLENRVAKLELGFQVPEVFVATNGPYETIAGIVGATMQVDSSALGYDEGVSVQLPAATLANKGQTITVVEVSSSALDLGAALGGTNPLLRVLPPPGQPLRAVPVNGPDNAYYLVTSLSQVFPFVTFRSTGDAWVCVSRSSF